MRPIPADVSRRRRAMTLLELLVTLVVFGSLVVMLTAIFSSSIRARQAIADNLAVVDRANGAMEIIVRDLETMHVYDSRAYLIVEPQQIGDAKATSIAFATSTPVRVSKHLSERPGLIEVAYLIGPDPNTPGAMRLFRRELEVETNPAATQIRTSDEGFVLLVDGLTAFHMEFLSQDEAAKAADGETPEFLETWDGGFGVDKLPAAIRITMTAGSTRVNGPQMTLERTIRLPVTDVAVETLQKTLKKGLGLE